MPRAVAHQLDHGAAGQPAAEQVPAGGQVAPELKRRGILFAGLDVIGDWLTEINVTSPTCIRELDKQYGTDIASQLMDAIDARLERR